ncbi:hypothetical protein AGMMS49975_20710 [Clostridia bacterium]|nr:hypothetical protein AGMMS49975_20710 [Clostridia bacterium]
MTIGNLFALFDTFEEEHFDEELGLINAKADEVMKEFSYLVSRVYYYDMTILVFDNFPNAAEVAQFAFRLTKGEYLRLMSTAEHKKFIALLTYIADEHVEFKVGLPYRLLKMLLLLIMYKAYVHVSVLSKLVLNQIYLASRTALA